MPSRKMQKKIDYFFLPYNYILNTSRFMEIVANPYKIQDFTKSIDDILTNPVSKNEFRTESSKKLIPEQTKLMDPSKQWK